MNYLKNIGMFTRLTLALLPIRGARKRIWAAKAEGDKLEAELTELGKPEREDGDAARLEREDGDAARPEREDGDAAQLERLEQRLGELRSAEREAIREAENRWSSDVCEIFDLKIELSGSENLPAAAVTKPFVVACNHQSNLDIVVLLRVFSGHALGFLAKDELAKLPLYGKWIQDVRSAFLDRGNAKAAVKAIGECEDNIRRGFNIAVFPEGTRGKSSTMGEFKKGSLRMAVKTGAPIIPVALEGSYLGFEAKGCPAPCTVRVKVLPQVATEGLSRHEGAEIAAHIEELIRAAHEELMEGKDDN